MKGFGAQGEIRGGGGLSVGGERAASKISSRGSTNPSSGPAGFWRHTRRSLGSLGSPFKAGMKPVPPYFIEPGKAWSRPRPQLDLVDELSQHSASAKEKRNTRAWSISQSQ